MTSITGYRSYDTLSGNDNDNSPVVFIQSTDWFEHEQFSQEVRFTGNLVNDTVHFTVGGIYYDASTRPLSRIHTPFSGFGPPGFPTFSFLNDDIADVEVLAGFANVAWDLTDALTLEGGVRITDEKKDYTFGRLNPDGVGDYLPLSNPTNPLTGWTGSYSDTVPDYRAALSYQFTPDMTGLCPVRDRPQGWRHFAPALQLPPDPSLRSGDAGFLRAGFQNRSARSQASPEWFGLPHGLPGLSGHSAGVRG